MATGAALCRNMFYQTFKRPYQTYCIFNCVYKLNNVINQSRWNSYISLQRNTEPLYSNSRKEEVPYITQPVRYYAKSRDKKKSDKGHKKKVSINEEVLAEIINVEDMQNQMQSAVDRLKDDFIKNLSLRSTSGSIEEISVSFEGKEYPLQDLAQVIRKNPKTVIVKLDSFPQVIPTVIQAIDKSGMNLNPQQDGTTLYIPIPKVTKEYRETLAKNAKGLFIKCRDNIKDIQNKFIKTVKNQEKDGLAKDTIIEVCEYIMFVASEYTSVAEKHLEAKQQELLKES